jgi:hypothetical protein
LPTFCTQDHHFLKNTKVYIMIKQTYTKRHMHTSTHWGVTPTFVNHTKKEQHSSPINNNNTEVITHNQDITMVPSIVTHQQKMADMVCQVSNQGHIQHTPLMNETTSLKFPYEPTRSERRQEEETTAEMPTYISKDTLVVLVDIDAKRPYIEGYTEIQLSYCCGGCGGYRFQATNTGKCKGRLTCCYGQTIRVETLIARCSHVGVCKYCHRTYVKQTREQRHQPVTCRSAFCDHLWIKDNPGILLCFVCGKDTPNSIRVPDGLLCPLNQSTMSNNLFTAREHSVCPGLCTKTLEVISNMVVLDAIKDALLGRQGEDVRQTIAQQQYTKLKEWIRGVGVTGVIIIQKKALEVDTLLDQVSIGTPLRADQSCCYSPCINHIYVQ